MKKVFHQLSYQFENSRWRCGLGTPFSKLQYVGDFSYFLPKSKDPHTENGGDAAKGAGGGGFLLKPRISWKF